MTSITGTEQLHEKENTSLTHTDVATPSSTHTSASMLASTGTTATQECETACKKQKIASTVGPDEDKSSLSVEETPLAEPTLLDMPASTGTDSTPETGGTPAITFYELKDAEGVIATWPTNGPVVHLKGFASRLSLSGAADPPADAAFAEGFDLEAEKAKTEELAASLINYVKEANPGTVTWDGDNYQLDSFTALVPRLVAAIPHLKVTAFLHEKRRSEFLRTWQPVVEEIIKKDITVIIVPPYSGDSDDHTRKFADLGLSGLAATKSTTVVCFGGGAVLADEYKHASALESPPTFALVPATRWVAKKASDAPDAVTTIEAEKTRLLGVEGVAIVAD